MKNTIIKLDASSAIENKDSSVTYDAYFTRPGIFEYRNPDGTIRRELRPDSVVAAQRHLDAIVGAPVIIGHPADGSFIRGTPKQDKLGVGIVSSEVFTEEGRPKGKITIRSKAANDLIRGGVHQLSLGYKSDDDMTPGIDPKYGKFDVTQTAIEEVDHVAIVPRGRAGNAYVKLDAYEIEDIKGGSAMTEAKKDPEKLIEQIKADALKIDALEASQVELQTKYDEAQGEIKILKQDLEDAKAIDVEGLVSKKIDLLDKARKHTDSVNASMTDLEIMRTAVTAKYDGIELADSEVPGAFAVLNRQPVKPEPSAAEKLKTKTDGVIKVYEDPIERTRRLGIAKMNNKKDNKGA